MAKNLKHTSVYLDSYSRDVIEYMGCQQSEAVNTGLRMIGFSQYVIYELKNSVNNRVYLGITRPKTYFLTENKVSIERNEMIIADVKTYGIASIESRILCGFPTIVEAVNYQGYLLNRLMDNGAVVYNDEIYTETIKRNVVVPLDYKIVEKLLKHCARKKMSISDFLSQTIHKVLSRLYPSRDQKS